mmetsp:Transcript_83856/g.218419  ORF Transcript_83856/g.218419 Transcript_83856/m.218419 type:complete len:87 (+) Transcript_83856:2-262(+)
MEPPAAPAAAATEPPAAEFLESKAGNAAVQAARIPAYCDYTPLATAPAACKTDGGGGCSCLAPVCEHIPATSHQWNSECCACGKAL